MIRKWLDAYKLKKYTEDLIDLQCTTSHLFYKRAAWLNYPLPYNEHLKQYEVTWVNENRSIKFNYQYQRPTVELEYKDKTTFVTGLVDVELQEPLRTLNKVKRLMSLSELDIIMMWFENDLPPEVKLELQYMSKIGIVTYPLQALIQTLERLANETVNSE